MNIYFVRHGESEHNQHLRESTLGLTKPGSATAIDSRDLPLTHEGKEQIHKLLPKLPEGIDAFICSNHIRTKETADIIQSKYPDQPYVIDERINALFLGSLDHKTFEEMFEITGIDFQKAINDEIADFRPYGGESNTDIESRVFEFLKDLLDNSYQNVVVVGSVETIKSVYKILFAHKAPNLMRALRIKNGSIHQFKISSIDIDISKADS